MGIQTYDARQPIALEDPSGIKPNDWLEDLGTLRQVDYVDTLSVRIGPGTLTLVHFKPQEGVPNLLRGMANGRSLTVWRTQPQPEDRALLRRRPMLRLEGSVNGRRVARNCESADSITTAAAVLLDACAIHELRLLRILKSLHLAALDGRTWGWSATEFTLSLRSQHDNGA